MTLQKREKILLAATAAVLLIWAVQGRVKSALFGPIEERQSRLTELQRAETAKTRELVGIKQALAELHKWRARSLPPNPYNAQRLYQSWLTDVAQTAGLRELKVKPGRRIPRDLYTAVLVTIDAEATFDSIKRFLFDFHRTDLAHRLILFSVEPREPTGDPLFDISLTAEGLAFSGIADRRTLFPRTTLKSGFTSSAGRQTIDVADAAGFPNAADFRIRIGEELLTVTAVEKGRWQVRGGAEGTTPSQHDAGEAVELVPLRPEFADRTLEDFEALSAVSLFVKPPPQNEALAAQSSTAPMNDKAAETVFNATWSQDGVWEAWLFNSDGLTELHVGDDVSVADVRGTVVEIGFGYLVLKNAEGRWRLEVGNNLRELRRIAEPATSDAQRPEEVSQTGSSNPRQSGPSDQ